MAIDILSVLNNIDYLPAKYLTKVAKIGQQVFIMVLEVTGSIDSLLATISICKHGVSSFCGNTT